MISPRYSFNEFKPISECRGSYAWSALLNIKKEHHVSVLHALTADAECTSAIFIYYRRHVLSAFPIEIGKQAKHFKGHPNYVPGKSLLTHRDPKRLIHQFAGTGRKVKWHNPGEPGYVEKVDFGECIGIHFEANTGVVTPTTWGKVHYSKHGAHIVPALPDDPNYLGDG